MSPLQITVELFGHTVSILTFIGLAVYITIKRPILRRTMQRGTFIYWIVILTVIVFSLANGLRMGFLLSGIKDSQLAAAVDVLAEYPSVIAQSILIFSIVSLKVIIEKKNKQKRILVIGAHPDDFEIACGATLAKMRDSGYCIRGLVMTRGEQGGNFELRPDEARRGASFLGLEKLQVMGFTDTRLKDDAREILATIEAAILEFQPDIILTHSIHDQHQDHQVVHEATLRAARNQSTILCYESPSVTRDFNPSVFVDVIDYIDIKIESIKEHWDQRGKPYIGSERVRGVVSFRGGQAKIRAAEGFEVVRALSSSLGEI